VTLTDGSNQKISARIQRTNPPPQKRGDPPYVPDQNHRINQATQIAAFTKPMAKDWTVDDLYTRVLKFPSGELLGRPYLDTGAQVTIGPVAGQIDELKAFAMWKGRLRTSQQLQPGSNSFPITPVGWTVGTDWPLWENGGLMKIGDEYVGYGRWNAHDQPAAQIQQAKRGWLNSAEELHDQGDSIFFMPWMSVSSLSQDVSEDDKTIRLNRRLGDASQYTSGYVLLDNEMAMFQWNDKDGRDDAGKTLSMPPRWDGQKGLYRGSFGTQATSHSKDNCLAYGMPFRYWDTYKAREFDNTMVWFQWGVKMDLAHWKTFTWKQTVQNSDPNVIVHALARVDNRCDFWDAASPGMKDPILLIDSITPNTDVQVKRTSYLQEAGQFDVRFLVEYKRDVSFDATLPRQHESWKRAPKITEIQVEYERPTQTLHHEDR
jgi:hypothetical protein